VYYTFNKIVAPTAVKVSRKLLTKWIETNQVVLTPFNELQTNQIDDLDELQQKISEEIKEMFKQALNTEESIDINSHFILDLGATSLDYLTLLIKIEEKYEIKFNQNTEPCYTVLQFTNSIVSKLK
jgi:acyl carrier protein